MDPLITTAATVGVIIEVFLFLSLELSISSPCTNIGSILSLFINEMHEYCTFTM